MNFDISPIVTWIETNPEAAGVAGTLILGVLGYFGGAFAWIAGLFKSKPFCTAHPAGRRWRRERGR